MLKAVQLINGGIVFQYLLLLPITQCGVAVAAGKGPSFPAGSLERGYPCGNGFCTDPDYVESP